jgi:geranylgeranyl reductase family protein
MNDHINNNANKKIIIIGAGPIGCYTASLLAKKGYDVEVYEEHSEIGKPVSCTGLVTRSILKLPGLREIIEKSLVNKIKYAEINAGRQKVNLKIDDYIIDRARFDKELAKNAVKNGAKIYLGFRFIDIRAGMLILRNTKTAKIKNLSTASLKCVIGADGPDSTIAKKLNPEKKRRYYIGKQVLAAGEFDSEAFKVYLGEVCPKFFAWIVPEDKKRARIGVAALRNPNQCLDRFISQLKDEGYNLNIKEIQAGLIPIYDADYRTTGRISNVRCYVIGDAAGHVKATTGGGIIPGLRYVKALVDCIASGKKYEPKNVEKELKTHLFVRKILNRFLQKDYEDAITMVRKQRIKNIFSEGDRDSVIKLLPRLIIAEPRLLKFGLKIMF